MEKMGGTIPSQPKTGSVEPVFASSPKGGAKIYVCDIPVNFQSDEPVSSSSKAPSDEGSLGAKKQTCESSQVCFYIGYRIAASISARVGQETAAPLR